MHTTNNATNGSDIITFVALSATHDLLMSKIITI